MSDSGTISEETSILGLRSLNIREAHERPEAMEEATRYDGRIRERRRILQGLRVLENQSKHSLRIVRDYDIPNVSEKVLRIILSYIDYVNRHVWRESK